MNRLVIVGAGPVGLHAASEAATNGFDITVVERGEAGAAISRWAHVKLFTPFSMTSISAGGQAAWRSCHHEKEGQGSINMRQAGRL